MNLTCTDIAPSAKIRSSSCLFAPAGHKGTQIFAASAESLKMYFPLKRDRWLKDLQEIHFCAGAGTGCGNVPRGGAGDR